MATSIDNGTQMLTFDFKNPATGISFNKLLHKILTPGIYETLPTLSKVNDTTITVSPFYAILEDSANSLSIKMTTTSIATVLVNSTTPLIVARYTWAEAVDNYAEITAIADGDLDSEDIILGRCTFSGSVLQSFTYDLQTDANIITAKDLYGERITDLESKVGQSLNTDDGVTFASLTVTGIADFQTGGISLLKPTIISEKVTIGTGTIFENNSLLTVYKDTIADADTLEGQIMAMATDGQRRIVMGYDTSTTDGYGYIKSGRKSFAWTPLVLQPVGVVDAAVLVGTTTSNGTDLFQVAPDTDISVSMGRVKLGYAGSADSVILAHYDHFNTSNYAMLINPTGENSLNAPTGQVVNIRNNNSNVATFSGSTISLDKQTIITNNTTGAFTLQLANNTASSTASIDFKNDLNNQVDVGIGGSTFGASISNKAYFYSGTSDGVSIIGQASDISFYSDIFGSPNVTFTQSGKVTIGTGTIFENNSLLTVYKDTIADADTLEGQIMAMATDGQRRIVMGYDTSTTDGYGYIKSGRKSFAWTPLVLQPVGVVDAAVLVGTTTSNGTDLFQVAPDTDSSVSMGRAKIGGVSDSLLLAHYDFFNTTSCALRQNNDGTTVINAHTGKEVRLHVGDSTTATFSDSAISLEKDTLITGKLSTDQGRAPTDPFHSFNNLGALYDILSPHIFAIGDSVICSGSLRLANTTGSEADILLIHLAYRTSATTITVFGSRVPFTGGSYTGISSHGLQFGTTSTSSTYAGYITF